MDDSTDEERHAAIAAIRENISYLVKIRKRTYQYGFGGNVFGVITTEIFRQHKRLTALTDLTKGDI
jgi:hypothetical protein